MSLIYNSSLCFWVHRLYLALHLLWSTQGLASHLQPCHDLCVSRGRIQQQRPLPLLTYCPPTVCEHRLCCWCWMRSTWMHSEGQVLLFVCCETKPAHSREQHIQLSHRNFINFILRCAARETRHAEPAKEIFGHGLGLCGSQASMSKFLHFAVSNVNFIFSPNRFVCQVENEWKVSVLKARSHSIRRLCIFWRLFNQTGLLKNQFTYAELWNLRVSIMLLPLEGGRRW